VETNQCLLAGDRAGDVLDCWRGKSCPGMERGMAWGRHGGGSRVGNRGRVRFYD
jgi:hypothetical protein